MDRSTVAILLSLFVLEINGETERRAAEKYSLKPYLHELTKADLNHDELLDQKLEVYNKLQGICEPNKTTDLYAPERRLLGRLLGILKYVVGGEEILLKDFIDAVLVKLKEGTPLQFPESYDKNDQNGPLLYAADDPRVVYFLVDELSRFDALTPKQRRFIQATSSRPERAALPCYLREINEMQGFELQVKCDVFYEVNLRRATGGDLGYACRVRHRLQTFLRKPRSISYHDYGLLLLADVL